MSDVVDLGARKLAWAKEVRRLFMPYFPAFSDLELAATEGHWLYCRVFERQIPTIRHRAAKAELDKMADALRVLANVPCWMKLLPIEDDDPAVKPHQAILRAVIELGESGLTEEVLRGFVWHGEQCIRTLPDRRCVDWGAVHAVVSLREWWRRNTGREAPRTLNPASKFARFVSDGFEFLTVEANPAAAFRRWRAEATNLR